MCIFTDDRNRFNSRLLLLGSYVYKEETGRERGRDSTSKEHSIMMRTNDAIIYLPTAKDIFPLVSPFLHKERGCRYAGTGLA